MSHVITRMPDVLGAAAGAGGGSWLRWVIVITMVGTAFLAWFLLRGYRDKD